MNFDRLAPFYRGMELILAGEKLHRCRTAFLHSIRTPRHVLVIGDGNGRFLAEGVKVWPSARFVSVDSSVPMLDLARRRISTIPGGTERVEFVHADVLRWHPPNRQFDLVVTLFVLDCFVADELEHLVQLLSTGAASGATWLVSDFCVPGSGPLRWRARAIHWLLYRFFRVATKLSATRLTSPDEFLMAQGFELRERKRLEWGLLHADWWERKKTSNLLELPPSNRGCKNPEVSLSYH